MAYEMNYRLESQISTFEAPFSRHFVEKKWADLSTKMVQNVLFSANFKLDFEHEGFEIAQTFIRKKVGIGRDLFENELSRKK